ncbi:MAG: LysM peptidoglycan-binding domain-containing protein [Gaiellaceae bacterium]
MFRRWLLLLLVLAVALALAVPRPSSGAHGEQRYVVRPGDTLWELAVQRFGGDPRKGVWEIRERNGMAGALLEPGMVLYLPARAGGA